MLTGTRRVVPYQYLPVGARACALEPQLKNVKKLFRDALRMGGTGGGGWMD